ncbi:unnamed protein product [Rhizophagus irregularis]|uniref:Uncharacterized protein n=1 Tax=Rhizophagus irregularis TaxID=588596 RepID=A0A915YW44_9GLOM|nr:unnamed protein product [Rhizophagus irregularis]
MNEIASISKLQAWVNWVMRQFKEELGAVFKGLFGIILKSQAGFFYEILKTPQAFISKVGADILEDSWTGLLQDFEGLDGISRHLEWQFEGKYL